MVAGVSSWRSSPLTWVVSRSASTSPTSSIVTIHGPSDPEHAQFLPWVTLNLACRTQSLIVPSFPSVSPAT